jgi:hypothetical protein
MCLITSLGIVFFKVIVACVNVGLLQGIIGPKESQRGQSRIFLPALGFEGLGPSHT